MSVHRELSQVAPLKRYVASGGAGQLYTALGVALSSTVAEGTVLRDMGKTVFLSGGAVVLRKVQTLPIPNVSPAYGTGYIRLGDASVGSDRIVALN